MRGRARPGARWRVTPPHHIVRRSFWSENGGVSRGRSETSEDDGDRGDATCPTPACAGSLTLMFESGRPCATRPITLGELDALTVGRASTARTAQLSTVGGERRLTLEI